MAFSPSGETGRLEGHSFPSAGISFQDCAPAKSFLTQSSLCYGEGLGQVSQWLLLPPARAMGDLSTILTVKICWGFGVKVYKNVEDHLRWWPIGVSHCHTSTHTASSKRPKLPFKCSYQCVTPVTSSLVSKSWLLALSVDVPVSLDFGVLVCLATTVLGESKKNWFSVCLAVSYSMRMGLMTSKLLKCQGWNWKFPLLSSRECLSSSAHLTNLPTCKPCPIHPLCQTLSGQPTGLLPPLNPYFMVYSLDIYSWAGIDLFMS